MSKKGDFAAIFGANYRRHASWWRRFRSEICAATEGLASATGREEAAAHAQQATDDEAAAIRGEEGVCVAAEAGVSGQMLAGPASRNWSRLQEGSS